MRLEDKFFNSFFYPLLVGIVLSLVIVITILGYYSGNFLDTKTSYDVYLLEKKYAVSNINTLTIFLSNAIHKLQIALQEQISLYLRTAQSLDFSKELNFTNSEIYNPEEVRELFKSNSTDINFASYWFINPSLTNISQLNIETQRQLYVFSTLTQSFYSMIKSNDDFLKNIYFMFEDTDLNLAYPISYFEKLGFFDIVNNYTNNPSWCTDEEGNIISYYKYKCRDYYRDINTAQKGSFDLNYKNNENRTIFITSPYTQFGDKQKESLFTMCIKFNDSISGKFAYACVDSEDENLFSTFDSLNDRLIGYVAIASVGFKEAFYFPQILSDKNTKTLGEFIYTIDNEYFLEEKIKFLNVVQKHMTSNYIKNINKEKLEKEPITFFDELYIDNNNGKSQKFFINNKEFNYCLFPIILKNMDGEIEHCLSIIYIFNKKAFYSHSIEFQNDSNTQIIFLAFLYLFFGFVLLYIITLSFKLLAKFIVIPIKNVHYMLEGINVGGEYRLKYLSGLKKKQEESLEKMNKINHQLMKKNAEKNKNININDLIDDDKEIKDKDKSKDNDKDKNIDFKRNSRNINGHKKNENSIQKKEESKIINEETKPTLDSNIGKRKSKNIESKYNSKITPDEDKLNSSFNDLNSINDYNKNNLDEEGDIIDSRINYEKKYDSDGIMIEKELNFYDFDEELLQYRPVEINNLVQCLLNLKSALMLTSKNQEVESIIGYTDSENTFSNFKNKQGSRMCQSNIGNLQSRLAKYDKAIYHLALSLQNVDLKKYFSNSLNDELDESDSLLHKIEMNYGKNIKELNMNKLVQKQQKKKFRSFSQKIIEILINSRYNKLINIYFKFFSFIQKNNFNYDKLSGYFMHTNFHTINYYHKILIQYIYLCFISNDLVKIGESILDYIEFLIKFKLKTTEENSYILNVNNRDFPEIKEKQLIKQKYFYKIVNWLNLFDNYAKQINDNSALGNFKNVLDAYTHNLHSNQNDLDSGNESASALLFQINLQRCDFLRGKFALACEDYSDALGFLINAAKKKRIVIDGLIKKRALKHIIKIAEKLRKAVINKNYSNLNYIQIFEKDKLKNKKLKSSNPINTINNDKYNQDESEEENNSLRLIDKVRNILNVINNDINETNEKQLKDIIVLIDCNLANKLTIDSYIDVVKTILKNYLSNSDRLGVFLLVNEYKIICPMKRKEEIDIMNFSKDLDNSSEKLFRKEKFEYSSFNENLEQNLKSESLDSENEFSNDVFNENDEYINQKGISMEDTIKSLNYCINYLKMKELGTNENFFIYFNTNIKGLMEYLREIGERNILHNLSYESNKNNKIRLQKEKKINFLLVGKIKQENEEEYKSLLVENFGPKSEVIPFDNMKKIKSILSSNNIINDNIIFPNEVYK